MSEINLDNLFEDSKRRRDEMADTLGQHGIIRMPDGSWTKTTTQTPEDAQEAAGIVDAATAAKYNVEYGTTWEELQGKTVDDTAALTESQRNQREQGAFVLSEAKKIEELMESGDIDFGRSQKYKGPLRDWFGPTDILGLQQSDSEQKLDAATAALTGYYLKFLTGVQMSDKERKFYERLLPRLTDTKQEMTNKLSILKGVAENGIDPSGDLPAPTPEAGPPVTAGEPGGDVDSSLQQDIQGFYDAGMHNQAGATEGTLFPALQEAYPELEDQAIWDKIYKIRKPYEGA